MSDANGKLLYYSNGIRVGNADFHIMANGNGINAGEIAQEYNLEGYPLPMGILNLPFPGRDDFYLMIHGFEIWPPDDTLGPRIPQINYTTIDMTKQGGLGRVMEKNLNLFSSTYGFDTYMACRHGNGRDWWVVAPDLYKPEIQRRLLSPTGFSDTVIQQVGLKEPIGFYSSDVGAQNVMSPDGKKMIDYDLRNGIRLFDFNRCTGEMSNFRLFTFPDALSIGGGASFSPNSRYFYFTTAERVMQIDTDAPDIMASLDTVAEWDGFYSYGFATAFGYMNLAMDQKIYSMPFGGSWHIHSVENPDLPGDSCMVLQHSLEVTSPLAGGIPENPNYRLYDWPGSPCDTLGIDGPVVATHPPPLLPTKWLDIGPNPARDFLFIHTVGAPSQPVQVRIMGMTGQEVFRKEHPRTVRSYGMQLPDLAAGSYIVQVVLADGRGASAVLVVVP